MSPLSITLRYAWSRRGLAVWVGAIGIVVTVTTTAVLSHRDRTLERTRFGLLSRERITAIQTEIDRPIGTLSMVAAANQENWVENERDFIPLAQSMFDHYPQIRSLAWVTPKNERETREQLSSRDLPAEGDPALSDDIWRRVNLEQFASRVITGSAPKTLPKLLQQRTLAASKFDQPFLCWSESSSEIDQNGSIVPTDQRRVLVCQAVRSPTSSDQKTSNLINDADGEFKTEDVQGWLVMEVDLGVAAGLALHRLSQTPIDFVLFSPEPMIGHPNTQQTWAESVPEGADRAQTQFEIAGHPWILVAAADRGSLMGTRNESPWLTMIVGLFASGALAAYVAAIVSRSARIERLVEKRTRQLQDANKLLQQENTCRRRAEERANDHAKAVESLNEDLILIREDMAQTLIELEQRNQELDEFNFIASHDLQEPVRKLISFSKLLKQDLGDDLGDDVKQDLHYIVDAAQRMKQLISDLLAFSKAGRAEMCTEPVNLNECVQVAMDSLMMQIEERKAKILVQSLPTVKGDMVLITQMLQNLISNAIKFCDEESPSVSISARVSDLECILCVQDNGIGISPQNADRVFHPFQRLHGRNKYEGNGIGLAICRKTVARHRGKIWVESEPGHGSRFFVSMAAYQLNSQKKTKVDQEPLVV